MKTLFSPTNNIDYYNSTTPSIIIHKKLRILACASWHTTLKNMLAFTFFFSLLFLSSYAQTNCSDFQFHGKSYDSCSDLHTLNSFIHWNYDLSSGTVDIAFRKSENEHGRWLAWAINPTSTGMVGSQAFVALQRSDGTLEAYTSPINTYGTTLTKGELSFRVHDVSAQNINGQVIVFAKFDLPIERNQYCESCLARRTTTK